MSAIIRGKCGRSAFWRLPLLTFYRNAADRETAESLNLGRGQRLTGIDLTLPMPRTPATLRIQPVFKGGSPVNNVSVDVQNLAGIQRRSRPD